MLFDYFNLDQYQGYYEPRKSHLECGDSVSWGDLMPSDNTGNYCIHRFLSYGDYNNSCMVEKSNVKSFLDDFDIDSVPVWEIFGSYGSHSILFNREWIEESNSETAEQMRDTLESLEDYPLYNEDNYLEMTWEDYHTQWEEGSQQDFINAIQKKYDIPDDMIEQLESMVELHGKNNYPFEDWQEFFESLLPSGEWYVDESPSGVYVLVDDAVKNCTFQKLQKFIASALELPAEKRARMLQMSFKNWESMS